MPRRLTAPAAVLCLVAVVGLLPAQTDAPKRHALLVGVNSYDSDGLTKLNYAQADVTALKAALEKHQYAVTLLTGADATKAKVEAAVTAITGGPNGTGAFKKGDTLLIGLAGHGLQFDGDEDSYFCPVDAKPFKERKESLLSVRWVYDRLQMDAPTGVKLVLVDACRNDPGSRSGITADSAPRPPRGVGVLLSCSAGQKAYEHEKFGGGHGAFFHSVLEGLKGEAVDKKGRVTWDSLRTYVKEQVTADVPTLLAGGASQSPEESGTLAGAAPVLASITDAIAVRPMPVAIVPDAVVGKPTPSDDKAYTSKATGMKFVRIKAGKFTMGSDSKEAYAGEKPAHEVTLTKDFHLGIHEVTRGQFAKFVADTGYKTEAEADGKGGIGRYGTANKQDPKFTWQAPSFDQTDDHPVVTVSWNDAVKFAEWISSKDGRAYRLPTEAEWEYSCRGGSTSKFHFGDDDEQLAKYGNVADGTAKKQDSALNTIVAEDGYIFTAPVGSFQPNDFGLFDMHGNAYEWCSDWKGNYPSASVMDPTGPSEGSRRVVRGGGWSSDAKLCRTANRNGNDSSNRSFGLGFRLALDPAGR